jgi:hypothetical protein
MIGIGFVGGSSRSGTSPGSQGSSTHPLEMQKLGSLEQILSNQNAGLGLFNLLLAISSSEDCAVLSEVRMFYGSQNEL